MAKRKNRIRQPAPDRGKRITAPEVENYNDKYIIFSLERIQQGAYCLSGLDLNDKAQFAESIFKRRNMTWQELYESGRHGLGCESIDRSAINAPIPVFLTEDTTKFVVLRFSGKKPMVGYRIKNIFYVLWFDAGFCLYDHG